MLSNQLLMRDIIDNSREVELGPIGLVHHVCLENHLARIKRI